MRVTSRAAGIKNAVGISGGHFSRDETEFLENTEFIHEYGHHSRLSGRNPYRLRSQNRFHPIRQAAPAMVVP
jgi:hypothetical protein